MYGTSPCSKAILELRMLYKSFVIHVSRKFEALYVYIGLKRCGNNNPGKADTKRVCVISLYEHRQRAAEVSPPTPRGTRSKPLIYSKVTNKISLVI